MGVNKRQTIKADIPQEIQTGSPLKVSAEDSYEMVSYLISDSATVPPAGSNVVYLYAPSGKQCEVIAGTMVAGKPAGATVGVHTLEIIIASHYFMMLAESIFSTNIQFVYNYWHLADSLAIPSGQDAQGLAMQSLVFDDVEPLEVRYDNGTDANAVGNRVHRYLVKERSK